MAAVAVMGRAVHAAEGCHPLEQVGAANGKSHANTGHAVELGEGAKHDHVPAFLDEVEGTRLVAEVDVGFVDQQDSVLGSVRDGVLDVFARRAGPGGVVGIADVDHAGIGGGREHGFDVVAGRALGIDRAAP